MTEFELHQLFTFSRTEFDVATYIFIGLTAALVAICLAKDGMLEKQSVRLLRGFYLIVTAFLVVRILAAFIRGGKVGLMLDASDPSFDFTNPVLQISTLIIRIAVFVLGVWLTLHCLNKAEKPYSR